MIFRQGRKRNDSKRKRSCCNAFYKKIDCCRDCMTKTKKIIEGESANE